MKNSRLRLAALLGALILAGLVFWSRRPQESTPNQVITINSTRPQVSRPNVVATNKITASKSLRDATALFNTGTAPSPEQSRLILGALREQLERLPKDAASTAIRDFLRAGADAPTGLSFTVGPQGSLVNAPSLRVFLLDYLAQVDPAAARAVAEEIFATKSSADEWAIALRNYARGDSSPNARAGLQAKVMELLRHEPWQRDPSIGYLEAFDVAVYAGGSEVTAALTDLVRLKDNDAVARAAFLALDRLSLSEGARLLEQLAAQPELMTGREATRANYFARAQVGDPAQRVVLERYLLNPAMAPDELTRFAGLYPNASFMISHNLITRTETPEGATLARQDREALLAVEGWIADPRFARVKPQLETIRNRLLKFVSPPAR
jgi:hypothetical protein